MFHRFAAGTAVASVTIAIAALVVCFAPGLTFERIYPRTALRCVCSPCMGNLGVADPLIVATQMLATLGERFWDSWQDRWQLLF